MKRAQFARINGSDLGKRAVRVFLCRWCNAWHEGVPPVVCECGHAEFDRFDSRGEAKRWAQLKLLERAGEISALQRQVTFPLFTLTDLGKPVKFASYIADYVYLEKGVRVIEDHKAKAGITPEADLKLRVMQASGNPVRLTT